MKYISTRGGVTPLSFEETVMMGLATDGGLLVPESIPDVRDQLESWKDLSFPQLSHAILTHFIGDEIDHDALKSLIDRSYQTFSHPDVTPVVSVDNFHILELFHGPTFAFKDVALQFLGNLFEFFLKKNQGFLNVLGATSGDTGSAAIYGLRGKAGVNVFILHPAGRISPIQEQQMTSVLDSNIHNLAIDGSFDDAQTIVKTIFQDLPFKQHYQLAAINSINWARILAQMVYYFYAYFRVQPQLGQPVVFSVPTGNSGNVLAGYYSQQMGLPIERLLVATNHNDILYRFFQSGTLKQEASMPSLSPAMDIQISSNFERFLFAMGENDSERLSQWMSAFSQTGRVSVGDYFWKKAQDFIWAERLSDEETLDVMKKTYQHSGAILDPHTAVGVGAAQRHHFKVPVVCIATAHPAKFGDTVEQALGVKPPMPTVLQGLASLPTRCQQIPASTDAVMQYLVSRLNS